MTQNEENLGYKGLALEAIRKAECAVGDIVRVSGDDKTYEGILIPRSESSDNTHIVVKMKSGYKDRKSVV
jgi:glutamyl-tRNA(Gln) amidotransferase subunit D